MSHFFLSYARGDDDEYVQRFFVDLCREIRVTKGLRQGERVGFMDSAVTRFGAEVPRELTQALLESAAFLPLFAPGYFLSRSCGRERATFEYRLKHYHGSPDNAGDIIPVLWMNFPRPPGSAEYPSYPPGMFGNAYAEHGLRQLIRLRRYEDDYRETVSAFATEIVKVADRRTAASQVIDMDPSALTSAFHQAEGRAEERFTVGSGTSDRNGLNRPLAGTTPDEHARAGVPNGPRHVHFVIASADRDEIHTVRSSLTCYGPTAQHWAPYRPSLPEPLGPYACAIAAGQQFKAELAGLDDLPERLDRASRRNQIVVILVDPWTARVACYGEALLDYDRRNEPTVPVLVAVSDQDPETFRNRDSLARTVEETFPKNSTRSDPLFHPDVRNPEQFAATLDEALQIALNRLMRQGTVFRVPPRAATLPRVVLESPDSYSNRRST
ncbi:MAG: hypothetical protein QG622_2154 [Actinomycetota bacterium]|nr:hypothetical protein [Actinomycetota bacterium]